MYIPLLYMFSACGIEQTASGDLKCQEVHPVLTERNCFADYVMYICHLIVYHKFSKNRHIL